MTDLVLRIFDNSLAACMVVLAVMVLRLVLRNAPRRLICAMWLLVALRLVCPALPESSLSLQPAAQPVTRAVNEYRFERFPAPGGIAPPTEAVQASRPAENAETTAPEKQADPQWDLLTAAAALWAAGAAAV